MRGTLHIVSAGDLGWLLPLLGPTFVRKSRRRYAELGLDEETCEQAMQAICRISSAQGPLTRAELAEELAKEGIPTDGQAAYHLLRRAGLEGILCYGPDRGNEPTYVLLEEWVETGPRLDREAALAELTRRYLHAYGPAGPHDLAAWSGLSVREARAGFGRLSDELFELEMDGSRVWVQKSRAPWLDDRPEDCAITNLLPSYDSYLLGYRSRDLIVPPQYARRIHPGGGVIRPAVLVDGIAAGTWRTRKRKDTLKVVVETFDQVNAQVKRALDERVRDLGRFLGVHTKLREGPQLKTPV
jgi:hypothetical protein